MMKHFFNIVSALFLNYVALQASAAGADVDMVAADRAALYQMFLPPANVLNTPGGDTATAAARSLVDRVSDEDLSTVRDQLETVLTKVQEYPLSTGGYGELCLVGTLIIDKPSAHRPQVIENFIGTPVDAVADPMHVLSALGYIAHPIGPAPAV